MASDRPQARSWPPFRPRPRAARRRGREPTPTPPAPPGPFPSPRTATAPPSRFRRVALNTTDGTREGHPLPRPVFPTSRAAANLRILYNHPVPPPLFLEGMCLLFGFTIGSFLNVVIARLPMGRSIVHPPSACPECGAPIRWYDNIPIVSWLALRARCRVCHHPISWRYPAVELLTGLLFALAAWRAVTVLDLVASMIFLAALVVVSGIDLEIG